MDLFVVPKEGVLIRDPKTKTIMPQEGFTVSLDGVMGKYWRRRLKCGDIKVKNKEVLL